MGLLSQEVYIIIFSSLFVLLLIVAVIIMVLIYQKRQTKFLQEKKDMQMQFENQLLSAQVEIHEQTLKTISEEIHDNIGQVLSLVKLNLNTFPPGLDEKVASKIDDTEEMLGKAINDLRDLNQSMHGDKITALGLETALGRELNLIKKTGKFTTQLSVEGNSYPLSQQKEVIIFRIIQEALNNAIKHSQATAIDISLQYQPQMLTIIIHDNGKGFNLAEMNTAEKGIGLRSMKNRATLSGADFVVLSAPDNGTTITIALRNVTP